MASSPARCFSSEQAGWGRAAGVALVPSLTALGSPLPVTLPGGGGRKASVLSGARPQHIEGGGAVR